MPSFNDFTLFPATRAVLAEMGISEPSPIQAEAIPAMLAGKDLIGQSATGSGKTLAYSIPLVERLARNKRFVQALVLVPTRELAVQVNSVLSRLAKGKHMTTALLVGGRPYGSQLSALRYGAQIVVGTPGRVKDHMERNSLSLSHLRMCVLDEADQMLDSGFGPEIEKILSTTPDTRQMALFSATMPEWIVKIEQKFLNDPVRVVIAPATGAESTIEQIAYRVPQDQKIAALCTLLHSAEGESSLIFGKTKYGVEKLGKQLTMLGYAVGTLHSNKSQRAREEVLTAFRHGRVQTLLATNVAARGLDIEGIHQVINYELPESSELFTHRIGRTGRMGHQGKAITLLTPSDIGKFRRMSRTLGQNVALQQLTIDEDAMVERPLAVPEVAAPAETTYGRSSDQRAANSGRGHNRAMQRQDRGKFMHAKNDLYAAPDLQEGQHRRTASTRPARVPAWQNEEEIVQPERERSNAGRYSDKRRGDRRSKADFNNGRASDRYNASSSAVTMESGERIGTRKPAKTPRGRRAAALANTRFDS
jgi:Superfamily II DNA and RNA helicases